MHLLQLNLQNFKNYREQSVRFAGKVTTFVGHNGAGKTNLLDAIHYLSFCKSYFNTVESYSILHGSEHFSVTGKFRYDGERSDDTVHCHVRKGRRKVFKVNGKELDRLADHIGNIPAVMLSPYDSSLIDSGSEERRRYLDMIISQFDRAYLDGLITYNRALVQRNALLKRMDREIRFDPSLLALYDEQLAQFGSSLFAKREAFVEQFTPLFEGVYQHLAGAREKAGVDYCSQMQECPDAKELLVSALDKDRQVRYTTAGVHKDDLRFTLEGVPVKRFGSQGQQKSFIIALKLAQFAFLKNKLNIHPLLLLDDIFDKLDRDRVERLMELVGGDGYGQIFITDTNAQRIETIFSSLSVTTDVFEVHDGIVNQ